MGECPPDLKSLVPSDALQNRNTHGLKLGLTMRLMRAWFLVAPLSGMETCLCSCIVSCLAVMVFSLSVQ
jgi:hypothetical protein